MHPVRPRGPSVPRAPSFRRTLHDLHECVGPREVLGTRHRGPVPSPATVPFRVSVRLGSGPTSTDPGSPDGWDVGHATHAHPLTGAGEASRGGEDRVPRFVRKERDEQRARGSLEGSLGATWDPFRAVGPDCMPTTEAGAKDRRPSVQMQQEYWTGEQHDLRGYEVQVSDVITSFRNTCRPLETLGLTFRFRLGTMAVTLVSKRSFAPST